MPSERFHKLKSVKKRTFLKVAYKEFALHSYEGASITRLVADLKMAKGSIYQYFDDKLDLYTYLVEHAHHQLRAIIAKTCPPPNKGEHFSEWMNKLLLIQTKFLFAIPSYSSLFIKHVADAEREPVLIFASDKIKEASSTNGNHISPERLFYLNNLPFMLFNFIIQTNKIQLYEIIKSDLSIAVPTDKLLYLCEAFLKKP